MIGGNAVLLIGAVGCAVAPSLSFLLASRFIQGIGASASAVIAFAMVSDAYPDKTRAASPIGLMNAVFTALMAMAPVAGGVINEIMGWRGNYAVVAGICFLSWILLVLFLPETQKEKTPFTLFQLKTDYRHLLRSAPFINAALAPSLLYGAYLSFIAQAAFLYTQTFGLSLREYALHQAGIVAVFFVTSLLSKQFILKTGRKACAIRGMGLCGGGAFGLMIMSVFSPSSPYLMTVLMSVFEIGFALCYPVIFAASLEIFPSLKGTASSLIMSLRAVVCAGSVGITGFFYNGHPLGISLAIGAAAGLGLLLTLRLDKAGTLDASPEKSPLSPASSFTGADEQKYSFRNYNNSTRWLPWDRFILKLVYFALDKEKIRCFFRKRNDKF